MRTGQPKPEPALQRYLKQNSGMNPAHRRAAAQEQHQTLVRGRIQFKGIPAGTQTPPGRSFPTSARATVHRPKLVTSSKPSVRDDLLKGLGLSPDQIAAHHRRAKLAKRRSAAF